MIIYLLKSPFDRTYRNVVDFIHYEGQTTDFDHSIALAQILLGELSAPKITISADDRAIKRSVDLTSLTIKYNYDEIRDYNYVIIRRDNTKYTFYFITNIVSNNDSPENPSCTLTLEWDVWNNNIDAISKSKSYNVVEMAHYDRFNLDIENGEIQPKFIKVAKQDVPTTKTPFSPEGQRYIPVFRVFQMTQFPNRDNVNDEADIANTFTVPFTLTDDYYMNPTLTILDSIAGKYDRNLIYSVVGIFDTINEVYLNNVTVSSEQVEMVARYGIDTPVIVTSNQGDIVINSGEPEDLYIPEGIKPYIESSYLSFNCPFSYVYNESDNKIIFTDNPIVNATSKIAQCVVLGDFYLTVSTVEGRRTSFNSFVTSRIYQPIYTNVNYYKNTAYTVDLSLKPLFRIRSPYTKTLDPQAFMYPYSYYSIVYGNEEVIMEPISEDDYSFKMYKYIRSPQTQLEICSDNGDRIFSPTNIFVDMPVPYSLGVLAETSYMVRNGTQLNTSKALNKFSTIMELGRLGGNMSVITSKYSSLKLKKQKKNEAISRVDKIGSLIAERLKINAFEKDLINTPAYWYPSMGECDTLYQDRIRVIYNEVKRNNPAYNEFMDLIYYYGYERTHNRDILDNTRINFDYCQTSNCNLCELKINNSDKEVLEEIFDRGVTKWHILYDYEDDSLVNLTLPTKDKNILGNNIEHKFETNPTYKNWVNS